MTHRPTKCKHKFFLLCDLLISAVVISAVEFEKVRKDEKRRDDVRLAPFLVAIGMWIVSGSR